MKHLFCTTATLILLVLGANCQGEVITIDAQPLVLKFTNPPFVAKGFTYVPLAEVTNELKMDQPLSLKNLIILHNNTTDKDVVFSPARAIAKELKLGISRDKSHLTIGKLTWEVKEKVVLVDLGKQRIFAFEGLNLVYNCQTCTGRKGRTTPTGIFQTWLKVPGKFIGKYGAMFWPTFFNGSIAIHSCPSDKNIKNYPDSHGCCRVRNKDREFFWKWIPGTIPKTVKKGIWFIPKKDKITVYVIP
ncbi:MAG: L,D-transpeptidase [Candidatus Berkelbacteria bacterium]